MVRSDRKRCISKAYPVARRGLSGDCYVWILDYHRFLEPDCAGDIEYNYPFGGFSELMGIAKKAEQAVLDAGADECLVYYRIHYRKAGDVTFAEKRLDR